MKTGYQSLRPEDHRRVEDKLKGGPEAIGWIMKSELGWAGQSGSKGK